MVNETVLLPAAAVAVAGMPITVRLFVESAIVAPSAGAGPLSVIFAVADPPPVTLEGVITKDVIVVGLTDVVAVFEIPFSEAVTTTLVSTVTCLVIIVKLADVAPAFTVTVAGTVPAAFADDNETTAPPVGAAPLIVTLPVAETPPTTELVIDIELNASGAILTVVVFEVPPKDAVMVTDVDTAGLPAVTVKVLDVAPAEIVRELGTDALALLAESVTTAPPVGAGPESLTVAVPVRSFTIVVGETEIDDSLVGVTVSLAVFVTPLSDAEMLVVLFADAWKVVM